MSRFGSVFFISLACLVFITTTNATTKHYKVSSMLMHSFLEKDQTHPSGYTGFVVDLLDELAKKLHFSYEFVFSSDNLYGHYDPETKKWNGLIGTLLNGESDMIVADLTESEERGEVVDFTSPFFISGIGILYHQLTRNALPFQNLDQLVDQTEIKYGIKKNTLTHYSIINGGNETFVKMTKYFENNPDVLVDSLSEGIERVMKGDGKYALIAEAVAFHVLKKDNPGLILVGDTFIPRHYGVVLPKGSSNTETFDSVVVELRENGVLDTLAKKWSLI